MKYQCETFLGSHDWSEWEEIESGEIAKNKDYPKIIIGNFLVQKRICSICKKSELDTQRTFIY